MPVLNNIVYISTVEHDMGYVYLMYDTLVWHATRTYILYIMLIAHANMFIMGNNPVLS